jgi:hypothetical protein
MNKRNDCNSIPMQHNKTALQNLINKFEEIKDLDYMVQIMILRGEAEKLLQQEKAFGVGGQVESTRLIGYQDLADLKTETFSKRRT